LSLSNKGRKITHKIERSMSQRVRENDILRPMKKIISFDLDGTLVDARYGDMVWNHGIPEEYSKKHGLSFDEARTTVMDQYRSVGDADLLWYEIDYWLNRFDLRVTADELLERYEIFISPLEGATEVMEYLKEKYILVIASNAARIFVEKELEYTDLTHYFSHIVSATTDYRTVKKQPGFYRRLCSVLGVSHEEIVHVGDHRVFDFEVPSSLGIEAYHVVDRSSDGAGDSGKVIGSLAELLNKL
jgi:HAD superfamily hydrolase (TIGR01493 family)